MNDRINNMAHEVLDCDTFPQSIPEICLIQGELQDPVAIAHGLGRYIHNQTIDIRSNENIVDRYRFDKCDYPSDYYKRSGHKHTNRAWQSCCHASVPNDLYYWGWTHLALDYEYVLKHGLLGYLVRIDESKKKYASNPDRLNLLEGMAICLNAISERYLLYAKASEDMAAAASKEKDKDRYMAIAHNCRKVPMHPADTFYEAIQAIWSMFLINPDSLGRIDQYLFPYFKHEVNAGTLSDEQAKELLQELFVKVHESQVNNKALPISGHNHLVVGGYLRDGSDGYNELSLLIMKAIAELPTFRPQVSFRFTQQTKPETIKAVTELNKRCPLIVFVNDEPRLKGMVDAGIAWEDAVEYTVVGCNEWSICGKSKMDLAHINLVHAFTELIQKNESLAIEAKTFDAFYGLWEDFLHKDIIRIANDYDVFFQEQAKDINVMTSALIDDCIESATGYTAGGPRYYGLSFSFNGLTNVTDSLSIIRQYVFEEKKISMKALIDVLKRDWQDDGGLRTEIQKNGHFFGNDLDDVDQLTNRIITSIRKSRDKISSPYLKNIVFGSFVGATHPNIKFGKKTPATPDGRRAGYGFTMGISQSDGKDKQGMTALLKSIAKLDYDKFCGCIVSNIKMDPRMADSPRKIERIAHLFDAFLRMGGMQLQVNYVSGDELRAAQRNPDAYKNLMVRVTGYSGFFTLFDEDLQNDIIARTEYTDA